MNAAERINDGASTPAAGAVEVMQVDDEIASILTPDCASIDCVRSSFMKPIGQQLLHVSPRHFSTIHWDIVDDSNGSPRRAVSNGLKWIPFPINKKILIENSVENITHSVLKSLEELVELFTDSGITN
ncbi:hypothetical protein TNCV_5119891 [Trichonephila clavipes]|nr:hypothetical protein TNCV_5119891 [Trichonephila clavipes]